MQSLDLLYANYEAELLESYNPDVVSYLEQFTPMKEKINKRGRKLLDYDNARHHYETTRAAKKSDEVRVSKVGCYI